MGIKVQCNGKISRCTVLLLAVVLAAGCLLIGRLHSLQVRSHLDRSNRFLNQEEIQYSPARYPVEFDIDFPYQTVLRKHRNIVNSHWFVPLTKFLRRTTSNQVTVVEATYDFLPVLLNWLVSALVNAQPPLENVLVLALDSELHAFLQRFEDVNSVYIDPWTMIKRRAKMRSQYSHIWIARLCIIRLLNHWGFDVLHYDVDAIVLKNLQPVLDEYRDTDIIGSAGTYPFKLGRKWGQTLCMGLALFRGTSKTELFWKAISKTNSSYLDDQVEFNQALDECGIAWQSADTARHGGSVITGQCTKLANTSVEKDQLRVAILPESIVCRSCKSSLISNYHVWHRLSARNSESKQAFAERRHLWFLKPGWNTSNASSVQSLSL